MKRILLICVGLIGFLGILFFIYKSVIPLKPSVPTVITPAQSPAVTVTIDTEAGAATVSGIAATNAYNALIGAAKSKNLELKTKQYDFGVFVEQVGTLANTKEKSWIYFVNGKAGTVAADKQTVNSGDFVQWKYIKPTIE